jgi:hypothetical protein
MTSIPSVAGTLRSLGLNLLVLAAIAVDPAEAGALLTGANVPNATRVGPADRSAVISQLKSARVQIIRFPVGKDIGDSARYAAQLHSQGIAINLIVDPQYPPGAPMRPPYPEDRRMYPSHPLSSADPALSRAYFQDLLSQLDANGVVLASIELGNEINWSAFNGEFSLPGKGKIFSLDDLGHDPEGQQVAKGLLQYLKILAVLKEARDHSKLNKATPIISAGLSPTGRARATGGKEDGVAINDTIQFLQKNGLDRLADGYGIHFYPWGTLQQADMNLMNNVITECRSAGSSSGKPCWITEWGVSNPNMTCPLDDSPRIPTVRHMMENFRMLAREGRLHAALYYSWNNSPGTKPDPDPITVFRCGGVSEAGRIALTP